MKPRVTHWAQLSEPERVSLLARPVAQSGDQQQQVAEIINAVRVGGDAAVLKYGQQFDDSNLAELEVSEAVLQAAASRCATDLLAAIDSASGRIRAFHAAGKPADLALETAPGLLCEARYVPISPVGLYVPGGSAPLISTAMMLAIPATLAGCRSINLCTPPRRDGTIDPAILATAQRCGVTRVFAAGGAQAIAAMAYGTETIPKCSKIFGPGNAWVTEAKRQVSSHADGAAQDMPAGPSEVLVIADQSADAEAVCWDLLSQMEHGPDSQAILISNSAVFLEQVANRLPAMSAALPRAGVLRQSLAFLRLIQAADLEQAVAISNAYAPEHLILNCESANDLSQSITTAGSIFVGPWSPESLGDYCAGTNHVLPTYGFAKAYSGLSVTDFMRRMTVQTVTARGLVEAGPDAIRLSAAEGLEAHRMAVAYRLEKA